MRICVYKDSLSTGRGADGAVKNLASGLRERGHDVALMEKPEFFARVLDAGKAAEHRNGGDAGNEFDVVVPTGSNEIVDLDSAGYFDRPSRAKVVLQLHLAPRGFFKWKHPFRNRRIRAAFDKSDAVQVLCGSYVDAFRRLAPHPRVAVIGNYAEIASFEGARPEPIILYPAAAVNRVKNQKLLIEAFALLAEEFPDWRVRLLGRDSAAYAKQCRKLIARKGLADRIELAGFTSDLPGEYSRAAFIAFPSTLEGFPLAILEAAQFSLAAVVQNGLPGAEDIVTDDTGIVTEPTVSAYAGGLRRMMADEVLRCRLGEGSRKHCEDCYSRAKILDQWESLLESVVK